MPITPIFAAVLALIYVVLSFRVIQIRFKQRINLGDGGLANLNTRIRVHANFAEYVPIALILLWFVETITFNRALTLALAALLLISRIMHVIGMHKPKKLIILRQIGMLGTFAVLLGASVALIRYYLPLFI